jgi:hypothetical protein
MPLLPIDLQTLFTQQTQVAKEQAVLKDRPGRRGRRDRKPAAAPPRPAAAAEDVVRDPALGRNVDLTG